MKHLSKPTLNWRVARNIRRTTEEGAEEMKYGEFTLGQVEAIINKLGGAEGAKRFLSGETVVSAVKKSKQAIGNICRVLVNYDRPVSLGIQAGNYNWVNDNITDQNFHPEKGESGTKEVSFELVHLNKVVSSEQALRELDNRNLRPATLRELLAFGETYPDEQRKYPIVALGSVWHWRGVRRVPCLRGGSRGRDLRLSWYVIDWREDCRFLGVRK